MFGHTLKSTFVKADSGGIPRSLDWFSGPPPKSCYRAGISTKNGNTKPSVIIFDLDVFLNDFLTDFNFPRTIC